MKSLKLMLVSAFLMMGSTAFAAIQYAKLNGVYYVYDTAVGEGTAAKPYEAQVFGLANEVTSLEVPASFTKVDEKDKTLNFKVTGFNAIWAKQTVKVEDVVLKDVTEKIISLSIDATNISDLANALALLKKLESLTVTGGAKTITAVAALGFTTDVQKSLTTLNIGATGITAGLNFKVSGETWKKLTSLTLPTGYKTIAASEFEGTNIASLAIPASVETIGAAAFKDAAELAAIDLSGTKIKAISTSTFEGAKKLATVALSGEVLYIFSDAFKGCEALASFTVPAKAEIIDANAFDGCKALATVTFAGDKVTYIGDGAFNACEALTTIDLSAQVIGYFGAGVFKGAKALTAVNLSKATITGLDGDTFKGCAALATLTLPKTITSLPAGLLKGTVLTSLDLSETGITTLNDIFQGTKDKPYATLTSIKLPKKLTTIIALGLKMGVFAYCTGLEEIEIPATLTSSVPDYAFYFCTSLTKVTYMPESKATAYEIGNKAFIGCTPFVFINTNEFYRAKFANIPFNATFGDSGNLSVTTVADAGTSGMFFGKFCPQVDARISKADLGDAKLYSVYVDENVAYFQAIRPHDGYYYIGVGKHAIVKTKAAATFEFEIADASYYYEDAIVAANNFKDVTVADYQSDYYVPGKYLYLLTNKADNGGFGFTYFKGTTMKKGNFFISTNAAPASAARLETVWLDEDGNVETAIKEINAGKAQDGAIYNLQGVRVKAAQKGFYIQNGKKYIKK